MNFRPAFNQQTSNTTNQFGTNTQTNQTPVFGQQSSGQANQFRPMGFGQSSSSGSGGNSTQSQFKPNFGSNSSTFQSSTSNQGFRPQGFNTSNSSQSIRPNFGGTSSQSGFGNTQQNNQQQVNQYGLHTSNTGVDFKPQTNQQTGQFNLQGQNYQQQNQHQLTNVNDEHHQNQVYIELMRLAKYCSPQDPDNLFKGILYNKLNSEMSSEQKRQKIYEMSNMQYQQVQSSDNSTSFYPIDRKLMNLAIDSNPDKENLYPQQIFTLVELRDRQKTLKIVQTKILTEINDQLKLADKLDREFVSMYLNKVQQVATNQIRIVSQYFQVLLKINRLNVVLGGTVSKGKNIDIQKVKKLISMIETSIEIILKNLMPEGQETVAQNLGKLVEAVKLLMHKQQDQKDNNDGKLIGQDGKELDESEESKLMRDNILKWIESSQILAKVLLDQFLENKASLMIIKNNIKQ